MSQSWDHTVSSLLKRLPQGSTRLPQKLYGGLVSLYPLPGRVPCPLWTQGGWEGWGVVFHNRTVEAIRRRGLRTAVGLTALRVALQLQLGPQRSATSAEAGLGRMKGAPLPGASSQLPTLPHTVSARQHEQEPLLFLQSLGVSQARIPDV